MTPKHLSFTPFSALLLASLIGLTAVGCNKSSNSNIATQPNSAAPIAERKTESKELAQSIAPSKELTPIAETPQSSEPTAANDSGKAAPEKSAWEDQGTASTGERISLDLNSIQATQRSLKQGGQQQQQQLSYFFSYQIGNDKVTAITGCTGTFAPFKDSDITDEFRKPQSKAMQNTLDRVCNYQSQNPIQDNFSNIKALANDWVDGMAYITLRRSVLEKGWTPVSATNCQDSVVRDGALCSQLPELQSCDSNGVCNLTFQHEPSGTRLSVKAFHEFGDLNVFGRDTKWRVSSWSFSHSTK